MCTSCAGSSTAATRSRSCTAACTSASRRRRRWCTSTTIRTTRTTSRRCSRRDVRRRRRDVRAPAPHRGAQRRAVRAVRLGRWRPGVPRLDESVARRARAACRSRSARTRRRLRGPTTTRRAFASCEPRRSCSHHHPTAAHFRYPYVYGPYQLCRASGRSCAASSTAARASSSPTRGSPCITTASPRTSRTRCCSRSIGRTRPAAGKIFNAGDEEVLSVRQVIELIAAELDSPIEIVSLPYELAAHHRGPQITAPAAPRAPQLPSPLPLRKPPDLSLITGTRVGAIATAAIPAGVRSMCRWSCSRGEAAPAGASSQGGVGPGPTAATQRGTRGRVAVRPM